MSIVFTDYNPAVLLIEKPCGSASLVVPYSPPVVMYTDNASAGDVTETLLSSLSLELQYLAYAREYFVVNTYNINKRITASTIYFDATMTTTLFTRVFTYNLGGNVTQYTITCIDTGEVLTKTFTYDVDDDMVTCTRTIT